LRSAIQHLTNNIYRNQVAPYAILEWEGFGFVKEAAIKMPMISVAVGMPLGDWIGKLLLSEFFLRSRCLTWRMRWPFKSAATTDHGKAQVILLGLAAAQCDSMVIRENFPC
jgi:hypothetical protein